MIGLSFYLENMDNEVRGRKNGKSSMIGLLRDLSSTNHRAFSFFACSPFYVSFPRLRHQLDKVLKVNHEYIEFVF